MLRWAKETVFQKELIPNKDGSKGDSETNFSLKKQINNLDNEDNKIYNVVIINCGAFPKNIFSGESNEFMVHQTR